MDPRAARASRYAGSVQQPVTGKLCRSIFTVPDARARSARVGARAAEARATPIAPGSRDLNPNRRV